MKKKIFIAAAVVFSSQLYAQKPAPVISGDSTKNLDEVVMTAKHGVYGMVLGELRNRVHGHKST